MKTIKSLSISAYGFLRSKVLECRISSIEDRIDKLQDLNLFFQTRFNEDMSEKIKNEIEYLYKRKENLVSISQ